MMKKIKVPKSTDEPRLSLHISDNLAMKQF